MERHYCCCANDDDERTGRAGRVKEGKCYHLIISPLISQLEMEPAPEMLTIPLETVSLRARVALEAANNNGESTNDGTTEAIQSGCLNPPRRANLQTISFFPQGPNVLNSQLVTTRSFPHFCSLKNWCSSLDECY